ncbi:MAG: protein kinase [Verrucomicrobia bacterium]|jgi:serine/threonine protein kinase|nr:protein kinase [Verrucomicrobiota bacterium]
MSEEAPHHHPPPFDVPSVEEMNALLPQYAFEKLAAYGGMGAVFRGRQRSLDRLVAIKILPPEFGAEPEFAERFKSEARAMAKLNHTNVVGVYDFGITTGGHLYLVMEWIEGPTLHELIHQGSIPVRKVAHLGMQLCDALAYAHSHKILHRDIKPGNIMINQDDQVKVADFGLARPITGEAEENPFGTPDYAAPEIMARQAVDQRADIFATGVVLYEMLTGRVPKNPRRSVTEYAPVSKRWDDLIDQATHADPAKRIQDALELRARISQVIAPNTESVAVVEVVADAVAVPGKKAIAPMHLAMIGAALIIVLGMVIGTLAKPETEKPRKQKIAAQKPEVKPSPKVKSKSEPLKVKEAEKKPEPLVAMPQSEPQKKASEPPTSAPSMAVAPAPAKSPPEPAPETPLEAIQRLEERDPELTKLVTAFAQEWAANDVLDTELERRDLAAKYIPALQRSLTGLPPEQRDQVLSEISRVANDEPLNEPDSTWPLVLSNLRLTYDEQIGAIQAQANAATHKMRAAQCALVVEKAKERAAAGKTEAAKLAEVVAAELAKLKTAPSLRALKESAAGTITSGTAPVTPSAAAP